MNALLGRQAHQPAPPKRWGRTPRCHRQTDMSDRINRLIAQRDFEALAALGVSVGAVARTRQLSQLAAVSEDLVNAARNEDAEQSAWYGKQLIARLRRRYRHAR